MTTGYFVSALCCAEHLYFCKGNFALYDVQSWNVPSQLLLGAAALGPCAMSFALVIPLMSQMWYVGPIARKTGDIGFEVAMASTTLLYIPLRKLEKHWRGVLTMLKESGKCIGPGRLKLGSNLGINYTKTELSSPVKH